MDFATGGLGGVVRAHEGIPLYEQHGLLGERLRGRTVQERSIPLSHESAGHVLSDFLEYDRTGRFVGEYMTKVDGATMLHAIEARSPFLDQQLWEFAAALPFDIRLREGKLKAVLRELARRRLGARVADGQKRGFGVPVQRWLAGRWRAAGHDAAPYPRARGQRLVRRHLPGAHQVPAATTGPVHAGL